MVYSTRSQRLKSEFLVKPGSDPARIQCNYGAESRVTVEADGSLQVLSGEQTFREGAPEIYQEAAGKRIAVSGAYRVSPSGIVSFWLGDYDRKLDLVVDPVISYSTFLGGNGQDNATAVAGDA